MGMPLPTRRPMFAGPPVLSPIPAALLDYNFVAGSASNVPSVSRSGSNATYFDSTGTLQTAAANVARLDYDPVSLLPKRWLLEPQRTNLTLYSEDMTAATGGWTNFNCTITLGQSSPDGGNNAVLFTTAGSNGTTYRNYTVTPGEVYTGSVWFKAGTIDLSGFKMAFRDNIALTFVGGNTVTPIVQAGPGGWYRGSYTITVPAGCTSLRFDPLRAYSPVSGTAYLFGAQLELGQGATSYIKTDGSAVTRAADTLLTPGLGVYVDVSGNMVLPADATFNRSSTKRATGSTGSLITVGGDVCPLSFNAGSLTPRGIHAEPQRTNYLPNSAALGGGPATWPTGWYVIGFSANGLTYTLSSPGVSNGIEYIDLRVAGTTNASASSQGLCFFSQPTLVAAALNDIFTGSAFIQLIAGSYANVTPFLAVSERNSSNTFLGYSTLNLSAFPAGASLPQCRGSIQRTMSFSTVAYVWQGLYMAYNSGVAIDFTIRIGLPQLEKGAGATSAIPTFGSALTRAADTLQLLALPAGFDQTKGTLLIEWELAADSPMSATICDLSDGSSSNLIRVARYNSSASNNDCAILVGGVAQASLARSQLTAGQIYKTALGWQLGDVVRADSDGTVNLKTAAALPSMDRLSIGCRGAGSEQPNAYIRRVRYWPQRLSNNHVNQLAQAA